MNSDMNSNLINKDLYLRELTRIYQQQTELHNRIERLAAAIRNDRPLPEPPPSIDIHKLAEALVLGTRV